LCIESATAITAGIATTYQFRYNYTIVGSKLEIVYEDAEKRGPMSSKPVPHIKGI
jgi:hypothetical protein